MAITWRLLTRTDSEIFTMKVNVNHNFVNYSLLISPASSSTSINKRLLKYTSITSLSNSDFLLTRRHKCQRTWCLLWLYYGFTETTSLTFLVLIRFTHRTNGSSARILHDQHRFMNVFSRLHYMCFCDCRYAPTMF